MSNTYQKMLDSAFDAYYERFKKCNALSPENAVTKADLFPEGQSWIDADRMHKMLSMGIVKRVGLNRYWLDEDKTTDSNGILKQRILIIIVAVILGLLLAFLKNKGYINF